MIPIRDNLDCVARPIATWLLIALNCAAFLLQSMVPAEAEADFLQQWAVVPAKITAALESGSLPLLGMAALSIVSAMFLHGSIGHILGNMIFLQAFGRAVENRFGSLSFVAFYLAGGFGAWVFHYITDPVSEIPAIGASGAIAAVLGAYLLFYPKAKFLTLFGVYPAVIQAYWLLLIWFGFHQLLPGVSELLDPSSAGSIAYWAHIGGFMVGAGFAGLYAAFRPDSSVCEAPIICTCECNKHKSFLLFRQLLARSAKCTGACRRTGTDCRDCTGGSSGSSSPADERRDG